MMEEGMHRRQVALLIVSIVMLYLFKVNPSTASCPSTFRNFPRILLERNETSSQMLHRIRTKIVDSALLRTKRFSKPAPFSRHIHLTSLTPISRPRFQPPQKGPTPLSARRSSPSRPPGLHRKNKLYNSGRKRSHTPPRRRRRRYVSRSRERYRRRREDDRGWGDRKERQGGRKRKYFK
eukprot:1345570-Amorphochlora_amoeboformis.AAC.1